jgi:hypothetical protein
MFERIENAIPDIAEKLEKAIQQNDRKRIKLLLNNYRWQMRAKGETDPNRIVESLRSASLKKVDGKIKVVWGTRLVHRANGRVEEVAEKNA